MKKLFKGQKGQVNIGTIIMLAVGMIFVAFGFIMFPNVTDACTDLLAYQYSGLSWITDSTYTGLTTTIGIFPLMTLIGYVAVAILAGFMGVRFQREAGAFSFKVGGALLLGLSLVFISLGLYIFPVALDGISSAYTQKALDSTNESVVTVNYTTANVTLDYRLFNDSISEVSSITSNVSETPAASSFNTTDFNLLISPVTGNATHNFTISYYHADIIDGTSGFTGIGSVLLIAPTLLLLGFLVATVVTGFFGIRMMQE